MNEISETSIPFWVFVGLGGMKSRFTAMIAPWIAIVGGAIALVGLFFLRADSYRLTDNISFYFFLILALGDYLAVRWVDQNDAWESVSKIKVPWSARIEQVAIIVALIVVFEYFR